LAKVDCVDFVKLYLLFEVIAGGHVFDSALDALHDPIVHSDVVSPGVISNLSILEPFKGRELGHTVAFCDVWAFGGVNHSQDCWGPVCNQARANLAILFEHFVALDAPVCVKKDHHVFALCDERIEIFLSQNVECERFVCLR